VSDIERKVHRYDPATDVWTTDAVDANLMGIWGYDDDYVFAWGLGVAATPVVLLWEGAGWRQIDAPDRPTWAMHGLRRDLVFAVGERGMIARWDGGRWTVMASGAQETLNAVHAVAEDEVYACGIGRELLTGSVYGWMSVLVADEPLHSIGKWNGDVWVGASLPLGLCKLADASLVQVAPPIRAMSMDVRGSLLLATNSHVVFSDDGKDFDGVEVEAFEDLVANDRPTWRR
jgi:hypothetical protein